MTALIWLLPTLPCAAGALLAACGRRADRLATPAAILLATVTLGLAVAAAVIRPSGQAPLFAGLPAGLSVDGLSAVLVVTVAAVTLAVLIYAAGELSPDEARARFFGLMLLFAGAMLVTVTATDLALLLMAWEVMGATSYALIGFWWQDPQRVRSATFAFLTTRTGDLGLYLAAGAALAGTGSLSLGGLAGSGEPWRDLAAAGIVAAALGKSAQLPFSFWLSRAMAGPSPVSALLHSATMVAAGAYLLLRVQPLLAATGWAATLVAWAGALTALLLGAVAVAQRDLKQLLAASTCAQIGFMVLAAGVGAVAGGTAQLVAHAAVKSLLLLCAGAWLAALGTKDLAQSHGAARRFRRVGVTFAVGALALSGLPPLSLWITKDTVLTEAARRSTPLYVLALAAAVLSAAYAAKALLAVWRPADAATRQDTEQSGTRNVGPLQVVPLPVLAVVAAGFGLVALPTIWDHWHRLTGGPSSHEPSAAQLSLSGVLAALTLLTVGLALRRAGAAAPVRKAPTKAGRHRTPPVGQAGPPTPVREPPSDVRRQTVFRRTWPAASRVLSEWLYLERLASVGVARPTMALARGLARFDDRVIDGAVRGIASAGLVVAGVAARRVEAGADGVAGAIGRSARWLGAAARRPQTGQLHTYYAQAAAALVVLALVLILVR